MRIDADMRVCGCGLCALQKIGRMAISSSDPSRVHLGVEGVELQLVGAFESLGVDLLKGDPVELALKDVDLLHIVVLAPDEVPLPCQCQLGILRAL